MYVPLRSCRGTPPPDPAARLHRFPKADFHEWELELEERSLEDDAEFWLLLLPRDAAEDFADTTLGMGSTSRVVMGGELLVEGPKDGAEKFCLKKGWMGSAVSAAGLLSVGEGEGVEDLELLPLQYVTRVSMRKNQYT